MRKKQHVSETLTVKVSLSGRGHNVKAYLLGPKDLKKLLAAKPEDALYENNSYSFVGFLCSQSEVVTLGFDPSRSRLFRTQVEWQSEIVQVADLVYDNGDEDALESFDPSIDLVVREDLTLALGNQVRVRKTDAIVLETISLRNAVLSTAFTAGLDFQLRDLELVAANLDFASDLARASYDLGLLDGMDQDIRAARYREKMYPLELEILNSAQSTFHLCRRVDDDEWEAEFLG